MVGTDLHVAVFAVAVAVFAKVHKLRTMGALNVEPAPIPGTWTTGILEFSTAGGDGQRSVPRRLILRHAMANPQQGVIFELYRPELIGVAHPNLRVRGIEPTPMGSGPVCAMVQEWLIMISGQVQI